MTFAFISPHSTNFEDVFLSIAAACCVACRLVEVLKLRFPPVTHPPVLPFHLQTVFWVFFYFNFCFKAYYLSYN